MHRYCRNVTLLCGLALAASPAALASGGGSSGTGAGGGGTGQISRISGPLDRARDLIAASQWPAALVELRRVDTARDPDWNNLMGYVLRRMDPPDLAGAESYYSAALAIDPKHRPTLEYQGELRLQQGDLAGAERNLAALKRATFFKSEEFKDLERAIASYRAAGNRYIPQS